MTEQVTPTPEDTEWAQELARSWVEVYKKSATTLALLRIVRDHDPIPAAGIAPHFAERTGWTLTDRGLYRSLRRLTDSGCSASRRSTWPVPVPNAMTSHSPRSASPTSSRSRTS